MKFILRILSGALPVSYFTDHGSSLCNPGRGTDCSGHRAPAVPEADTQRRPHTPPLWRGSALAGGRARAARGWGTEEPVRCGLQERLDGE